MQFALLLGRKYFKLHVNSFLLNRFFTKCFFLIVAANVSRLIQMIRSKTPLRGRQITSKTINSTIYHMARKKDHKEHVSVQTFLLSNQKCDFI